MSTQPKTQDEYLEQLGATAEAARQTSRERAGRMQTLTRALKDKWKVDDEVRSITEEMLQLAKQEAAWSANWGNRALNLIRVGRNPDPDLDEWEDYRPQDMGKPEAPTIDKLDEFERYVLSAASAAGFTVTIEWKWYPLPCVCGGLFLSQLAW